MIGRSTTSKIPSQRAWVYGTDRITGSRVVGSHQFSGVLIDNDCSALRVLARNEEENAPETVTLVTWHTSEEDIHPMLHVPRSFDLANGWQYVFWSDILSVIRSIPSPKSVEAPALLQENVVKDGGGVEVDIAVGSGRRKLNTHRASPRVR